jgi:RNA polymerase sigma factor (sigma-70 family)
MSPSLAPVRPAGLHSDDVATVLGAAARGDNRAWEELVRRYGRLVTATVRAFRLQEADAADAEQRTWLRLVEHHRGLRDPDHLGGWLITTATRECLAILRSHRGVADLADADVLPDPDDVEQRVVDADEAARLWDVVTLLPPRGRAVVRALFADERLPYAEIARSTGIPVGSLGPTRARVLRQLRQLMLDDAAPARAGQPGPPGRRSGRARRNSDVACTRPRTLSLL